MSDRKKCKTYHHGDLRNTLIIAAAELIEERGSVDFAMIEAARRAGVSSAAPYRHFRDREALLDAVAQVAFIALDQLSRDIAASHERGSEECIIALCKAYIRFVTDHPQFYDLMWGDQGLRIAERDLANSGFYVLEESVHAWCEASAIRDEDTLGLAVKLWATAHGLACLAMNHTVYRFIEDADIYALLESSTRTFLDGLRRRVDE
jgi:AcrR family transcriptional regulator